MSILFKTPEPLAEIRMFRPTWPHVAIELLNASTYGVAAWKKLFLQNPPYINHKTEFWIKALEAGMNINKHAY